MNHHPEKGQQCIHIHVGERMYITDSNLIQNRMQQNNQPINVLHYVSRRDGRRKGRNAHNKSVQDATLRQEVARAAVEGWSPELDYCMLRYDHDLPSVSGQTVNLDGGF